MFGSLGLPEILFIMVVALLIFGPRKLPEIGRTLGRAMGEFRKATSDLKRSFDSELTLEETRPQPVTPGKSVPQATTEQPEPPPPSAAEAESEPEPEPKSEAPEE